MKGKIDETNSENFLDRILTTEYQLCKYVNHTVGMAAKCDVRHDLEKASDKDKSQTFGQQPKSAMKRVRIMILPNEG